MLWVVGTWIETSKQTNQIKKEIIMFKKTIWTMSVLIYCLFWGCLKEEGNLGIPGRESVSLVVSGVNNGVVACFKPVDVSVRVEGNNTKYLDSVFVRKDSSSDFVKLDKSLKTRFDYADTGFHRIEVRLYLYVDEGKSFDTSFSVRVVANYGDVALSYEIRRGTMEFTLPPPGAVVDSVYWVWDLRRVGLGIHRTTSDLNINVGSEFSDTVYVYQESFDGRKSVQKAVFLTVSFHIFQAISFSVEGTKSVFYPLKLNIGLNLYDKTFADSAVVSFLDDDMAPIGVGMGSGSSSVVFNFKKSGKQRVKVDLFDSKVTIYDTLLNYEIAKFDSRVSGAVGDSIGLLIDDIGGEVMLKALGKKPDNVRWCWELSIVGEPSALVSVTAVDSVRFSLRAALMGKRGVLRIMLVDSTADKLGDVRYSEIKSYNVVVDLKKYKFSVKAIGDVGVCGKLQRWNTLLDEWEDVCWRVGCGNIMFVSGEGVDPIEGVHYFRNFDFDILSGLPIAPNFLGYLVFTDIQLGQNPMPNSEWKLACCVEESMTDSVKISYRDLSKTYRTAEMYWTSGRTPEDSAYRWLNNNLPKKQIAGDAMPVARDNINLTIYTSRKLYKTKVIWPNSRSIVLGVEGPGTLDFIKGKNLSEYRGHTSWDSILNVMVLRVNQDVSGRLKYWHTGSEVSEYAADVELKKFTNVMIKFDVPSPYRLSKVDFGGVKTAGGQSMILGDTSLILPGSSMSVRRDNGSFDYGLNVVLPKPTEVKCGAPPLYEDSPCGSLGAYELLVSDFKTMRQSFTIDKVIDLRSSANR